MSEITKKHSDASEVLIVDESQILPIEQETDVVRLRQLARDFRNEYQWAFNKMHDAEESMEATRVDANNKIAMANSIIEQRDAQLAQYKKVVHKILDCAPAEEPEDWRGCGNEDDAYRSGCDREHYRLAQIIRSTLTDQTEETP